VVVVAVAGLGLSAPAPAHAAGIVTHAWMALDAIDHVRDDSLRALLDAHRDQVRAGAEFPDGGYWTRTFGTPGGDYGEEAHWQRFIDSAVDRIREDPGCGDLRAPDGPCAATIAHVLGAAGHGMGDEVWDWLFEPNGPEFGEQYLPPEWAGLVGPGGLEAQLDVHAIAHLGRPTGPTPDLPDPALVIAAFAAVGRGDISIDALPVGENMLEVERGVEAVWAADHAAALERAMPWTTAHMVTKPGGVEFTALAIAGYYDGLWDRLLGTPHRTRVSVVAPSPGTRRVPATGWTGAYSPGSNPGNTGGATRIVAVLTSAPHFNRTAGGPPVDAALPADAFRLRVARTGAIVPARTGYPRLVPYNPEAGEHVVAFQPAGDLAPCTAYRAEITTALRDASGQAVEPYSWRFRTSGCERGRVVRGTVTCPTAAIVANDRAGNGAALTGIGPCVGGQDGRPALGATLPVARGAAVWRLGFPTGGCDGLHAGVATLSGDVRWEDGAGREIGWSHVPPQPFDPRGGRVLVDAGSRVLGGQVLALRLAPGGSACTTSPRGTSSVLTGDARTTSWPAGD
jgi:hypothetical protein